MSDRAHFDRELYSLDQRIRRLGIACGADLRSSAVIVALIQRHYQVCRNADMLKREELRGLLMLKYRIEAHCIDELGAQQCRAIIADVDARLRRRGIGL